MIKVELKDASDSLEKFAKSIRKEPLMILKNGKPMAVLMSTKNIDKSEFDLSFSEDFNRIIKKSRQSIKKGKGIKLAKLKKDML